MPKQNMTCDGNYAVAEIQGCFSIVVLEEKVEEFKTAIQRAANLWPDASPEFKEFADLITNGEIMQLYKQQDTSPKKKEKTHEHE